MNVGSVNNMLMDFEDGVYDNTKGGKCTQCGECCSCMLPLSEREIKEIKDYVRKNNIRPVKHMRIPECVSMDLVCPFCDTKKPVEKCSIYEIRPLICRLFVCNDPNGALRYPELYKEPRRVVNIGTEIFGCDAPLRRR